MKSLFKETFRAAYFLSPIIVLCSVSAMTLMKAERKEATLPEEQKKVSPAPAGKKAHENSDAVFNPVYTTGPLMSFSTIFLT